MGMMSQNDDNKKEKKNKLVQSGNKPSIKMKNEIDYYQSIHTQQIQRSDYMKLDDNILNYDLDNINKNILSDEEIKEKREQLSRVQVKFLSSEFVKERTQFIRRQKVYFMNKINQLKSKGYSITNQNKACSLIEDSVNVTSLQI